MILSTVHCDFFSAVKKHNIHILGFILCTVHCDLFSTVKKHNIHLLGFNFFNQRIQHDFSAKYTDKKAGESKTEEKESEFLTIDHLEKKLINTGLKSWAASIGLAL